MDSLKKIVARIEQRLEALDTNATAASRAAGLSASAIRNLQRGARGEIDVRGGNASTYVALAPALGTTVAWLTSGEGPETIMNEDAPPLAKVASGRAGKISKKPSLRRNVAQHSDVSNELPATVPEIELRAGASYAGGFSQEEQTIDEFGNSVSRDAVRFHWGIPVPFLRDELHVRPGRAHILAVRGDSMNDALFDGDRAIIDLDDTDVSQGGIFALLDDNASVIIKQVELLRGRKGQNHRRILCTSRNPVYAPFELELGETVRILGRVASKITRL